MIEVGAGNGMTFGPYPGALDDVVVVEPEDQLRAVAERGRWTLAGACAWWPGHGYGVADGGRQV